MGVGKKICSHRPKNLNDGLSGAKKNSQRPFLRVSIRKKQKIGYQTKKNCSIPAIEEKEQNIT